MISRKPILPFVIIGLVALAALLTTKPFDGVRKSVEGAGARRSARKDAAPPPPTSVVKSPAVILLGQNANLHGDLIEVDISFKNNTNRVLGGTRASVILYRPDGSFYKSKEHYIILSAEPLGPGEIGTFEFYIDNPERLSDYKYQVIIH